MGMGWATQPYKKHYHWTSVTPALYHQGHRTFTLHCIFICLMFLSLYLFFEEVFNLILFQTITVLWIELPWPENLPNTCVRHTETLDSCFNLIGLISSVYHDLPHWRLNQQPQNAEPKLYYWAISSHRTQVMPNQLVMAIVQSINLNVSCKLHPYSLQRTQSPPGPCLPRRIENIHPSNYYNLKGKDIDVHFLFLSWGIILWIELPWPENPANLHSVVAGSISNGGDHDIHCWWGL